jgi:tetratricopeptide (TPR) repeat protein
MKTSRIPIAVAVAVAAALAAFSPRVAAQPAKPAPAHKKPSQKDLDDARKHFEAAEKAKAKGDFKTAAVEYLAAYELFQEPEFFYDVAEVYKMAGDDEQALTYYEKYLELDPTGRGAAAARTAADELRRSIAAKADAAKRAADEAAAKQKAADDAARQKAAADEAAKQKALADAAAKQKDAETPAPATSASPGRGLRIGGMVSGGAGIVSLGVGIVFGAKASSISKDLSNADTFDQAKYDEGKAANRNMYIFTGVGAAALVAGGVLYYLGHKQGEQPAPTDVTIAPVLTPSGVALTATGRF